MLYAFGSNGSGQLNVGHSEDLNEPAQCLVRASAFSDIRIVGGGNHTFIHADGKVFLSGSERPDALSDTFRRIDEISVYEVPFAKLFAATWDAFAVVCARTKEQEPAICTFGSTDKGQLGRRKSSGLEIQIPSELGSDYGDVVCIAGGVQHFVVVLNSGEVFGWGNGRKGQLGPEAQIVETPRRIDGIGFKVKHAVCGREFTYLLGDPKEGQHTVLGSDKWSVKSQMPQKMFNWKSVGANWGGISVLIENGELVSWGRNDHGQLGPGSLPPLREIAVGSEHSLALSNDGQVLSWGWGEHGNCGKNVDESGNVKGRWNTIEISMSSATERVRGLGAGCATSWIWTG